VEAIADSNVTGQHFMVDDWLLHTPPDVIAKNFGLKNSSIFGSVPSPDPYILNGTVAKTQVTGGKALTGDASFIYRQASTLPKMCLVEEENSGRLINNFPVSKTIAATNCEASTRWAPGGCIGTQT